MGLLNQDECTSVIINLTKDQDELLRNTGHRWVSEGEYDIYQNPMYFNRLEDGSYEMLYFDELPDEVQESVRRWRDKHIDSY